MEAKSRMEGLNNSQLKKAGKKEYKHMGQIWNK